MPESEIITSRDNSKLKIARSVRDGREPGLIFIEGIRLVSEAVRSGMDFEFVLTSADLRLDDTLPQNFESTLVAPRLFDSIADTANSQGMIAIGRRPLSSIDQISAGPVVGLHQVNNPSNLGAVVRTAEAAGVTGLITTIGSADAFSPKALRASMGSSFRLPIVEKMSFEDLIAWGLDVGLVSTAADISGITSYTDLNLSTPRLIIFGSEAHGLDDRELRMIDETFSIPMKNEVESLNLAVSAGIVLFEAKRQRESE